MLKAPLYLLIIGALSACSDRETTQVDDSSTADDTATQDTGESAWPSYEGDLPVSTFETFGGALADQVSAGDGAGIDGTFRNSGVVLRDGNYFGVNGVHPVNNGDYTSYYPKSVVEASLSGDSIAQAWSFDGLNGHEVDMEGLTWAGDTETLYVGDEYNYIYALDLDSGTVETEWDLADVGVSTNVDKGIEALTWSPVTGLFYAGIQDDEEVVVVDLADGGSTTLVDRFSLPAGWAPSGLYGHSDGTLYLVSMSGGGTSGSQRVYRYSNAGELLCTLDIPASLGMTRPDGIFIDEAASLLYIADSQGPLYGGSSLYQLAWSDPCNGGK